MALGSLDLTRRGQATPKTRFPASVRAEFASDVFDGPAWRGVSEAKRTFAFCFRRSLTEVTQISPAV